MFKRASHLVLILASIFIAGASAVCLPALSQEPQVQAAPSPSFGGWRPRFDAISRWRQAQGEPSLDDIQNDRVPESELKKRPLLYWRKWANTALPVVPVIVFVLALSIACGELLPGVMEASRQCCRRQFWPSFGRGMLAVLLLLCFCRPLFRSEIGAPLGFLIVAVLELSLLLGLSVVTTLIGENILVWMKVSTKLERRPRWRRILIAFAGTIPICLMLLLPEMGALPRVGTRLGMLICILGLGAILKTRFESRQLP